MRHPKPKKARANPPPKTEPPKPSPGRLPSALAPPPPVREAAPCNQADPITPPRPAPPGSLWPHGPWLLGLALAPLLFGTLYPAAKAVVALLFALSLFSLLPSMGGSGSRRRIVPALWGWLALGAVLLPLVPVPRDQLALLSPNRFALLEQFPLDPPAAWIPFTLSISGSLQRLADLALIGAAFWLARCAAPRPGFVRWLVGALALSVGLLAASEVYFEWSGQEKLLGLLPDRAGHAAGTFPNRNHFASYLYVAVLFLLGWLLRQTSPLRFSRGLSKKAPARLPLILLGLTLAFGLVMATRTGSRAGVAACLAGAMTWLVLLSARSPSRHRQLRVLGTALLALMLIAASGDYLLNRLSRFGEDLAFKSALWQEALNLTARFPVLGTGSGAFAVAFNHFKSFGGDRTFLHAENEWVQTMAEHGLLGGSLLFIPLGFLLWAATTVVRRELPSEPELAFGAFTGLVCFATHATVEFVFQIPANAILAGVLAGFLMGCRDEIARPLLVPPAGWWRQSWHGAAAVLVLAIALAQGTASFYWHQASFLDGAAEKLVSMRQALRFWPWDSGRALALTREEVRALPMDLRTPDALAGAGAERLRAELDRALRYDPYSWELRLERAWLNLTLAPELGIAQARECVRLNPLQAGIPLQLARHFATRDRAQALEFLEMATLTRKEDFLAALEVAWEMHLEPAALWTIINDTPPGLEALAEFAARRELPELAAQARTQLVVARRH